MRQTNLNDSNDLGVHTKIQLMVILNTCVFRLYNILKCIDNFVKRTIYFTRSKRSKQYRYTN